MVAIPVCYILPVHTPVASRQPSELSFSSDGFMTRDGIPEDQRSLPLELIALDVERFP
jgi:hypothetical protein